MPRNGISDSFIKNFGQKYEIISIIINQKNFSIRKTGFYKHPPKKFEENRSRNKELY